MTSPFNRILPDAPADNDELAAILALYPAVLQPVKAEYLASAGGFSGARFWRIATHSGELCLRRWPPEHPSPERLAWIHSVLRHAAAHGFDRLPVPLTTCDGNSWVERGGALWELSPWMRGRADFSAAPTRERLRDALRSLAQFHRAVESFGPRQLGNSQSVRERWEQVARLCSGEIRLLSAAVRSKPIEMLQEPAMRLLELFDRAAEPIARSLSEASTWQVPLGPCLRDIWHDHVFFGGDRVTGFVDFGTMRVDSVAGDIARLLGSLAGDDLQSWRDGVSAYETVRPLNETERSMIPVFDHSGTLLAGTNWLDWIYRQQRQFGDLSRVRERLAGIVNRLEWLCGPRSVGISLTLTPPLVDS